MCLHEEGGGEVEKGEEGEENREEEEEKEEKCITKLSLSFVILSHKDDPQ